MAIDRKRESVFPSYPDVRPVLIDGLCIHHIQAIRRRECLNAISFKESNLSAVITKPYLSSCIGQKSPGCLLWQILQVSEQCPVSFQPAEDAFWRNRYPETTRGVLSDGTKDREPIDPFWNGNPLKAIFRIAPDAFASRHPNNSMRTSTRNQGCRIQRLGSCG